MDDSTKTLVKALLVVFVVIPAVAGVAAIALTYAGTGIANLAQKAAFKKKIKEGLKNGTIIKDGDNYYEVEIVNNIPV